MQRASVNIVSEFWQYVELRRACFKRRFPHLAAREITSLIKREFQSLTRQQKEQAQKAIEQRQRRARSRSSNKTQIKA